VIFFWKGKGLWIPSSLMAVGLWMYVHEWLFDSKAPDWQCALLVALAGLSCVGLGLHARFSHARWVFDPRTGCERFKRPSHSFYWIPADYWGLFYLALATAIQSGLHGAAK
jgi:hypothetical protein